MIIAGSVTHSESDGADGGPRAPTLSQQELSVPEATVLSHVSPYLTAALAVAAAWKPGELLIHWIKRSEQKEDDGWARVRKLESDVAHMRKQIEAMTTREARIIAYYARRENRIITAFELALLAPLLPEDERADTIQRSRTLVTEALATVFDGGVDAAPAIG
jgi:hypothetical protein